MTNVLKVVLILTGMASLAVAGTVQAPEIDASTGAAAVTLLAGGLLVLRSRRRG